MFTSPMQVSSICQRDASIFKVTAPWLTFFGVGAVKMTISAGQGTYNKIQIEDVIKCTQWRKTKLKKHILKKVVSIIWKELFRPTYKVLERVRRSNKHSFRDPTHPWHVTQYCARKNPIRSNTGHIAHPPSKMEWYVVALLASKLDDI